MTGEDTTQHDDDEPTQHDTDDRRSSNDAPPAPESSPAAAAAEEIEIEPKPLDGEQQKAILKPLFDGTSMVPGEQWYLIHSRWMKQWKDFVGYMSLYYRTPIEPGPIDNTPLLARNSNPAHAQLAEELMCDFDYVLVPRSVWLRLHAWYGGGPELQRTVIEYGQFSRRTMVEVYPLLLKLVYGRKSVQRTFSRVDTVASVKAAAIEHFAITDAEDKVKVYNYYLEIKGEELKPKQTLDEARLSERQPILIVDSQNPGPAGYSSSSASVSGSSSYSSSSYNYGSSAYGSSSSNPSSYGSSSASSYDYGYGKPAAKGLTGLSNLGNTCFMNSALQCLSNCKELTEYFLSDRYLAEINTNNPLGMHGRVAKEYGALVKQIWSGTSSVVAPRGFKHTLSDFAPQFIGYAQHDAQELLSFLLDGLHEDLNRVLNKPPTSVSDSNDRSDHEVAAEHWQIHLQRNQSVIVDKFQGQFKSRVTCPTCGRISITFDPFMYLSLPLSEPRQRRKEFFVVWHDQFPPTKYAAPVDTEGSIRDYKQVIATSAHIQDPNTLVVTNVYLSKFTRTFRDSDPVSLLDDAEKTFVYQLPHPVGPAAEYIVMPVIQRTLTQPSMTVYSYSIRSATYKVMGYPFMLQIKRSTTLAQVYEQLWPRIQSFLRNSEAPINHRLFSVKIVDSSGTRVIKDLEDPEAPLLFDERQTPMLSIDWNPELFASHYDDKRALTAKTDDSVNVRTQARPVSLTDCIEGFSRPEILSDTNMWYCSVCKEHKRAEKKLDIWRLPKYLVIHLKRFAFTSIFRSKIDTVVEFPLENFDLTQYELSGSSEQPSVYNLIAISNHMGGMGGGHYTAYAKNATTGEWYLFDDSSVSRATGSRLVSSSAYLLFYERADADAAADASAMETESEAGEASTSTTTTTTTTSSAAL